VRGYNEGYRFLNLYGDLGGLEKNGQITRFNGFCFYFFI